MKDLPVKNNIHIIFILGILIALIIALFPIVFMAPVLIMMTGILIGLFLFIHKKETVGEHVFLSGLFFVSFVSRVTISLFLYSFVYIYKGSGLLGDGWCYSENGYSILQMWLGGMRDMRKIYAAVMRISPSGNLGSFDFWNAIVYYFTGKSPVSVIFINCLASSLTVIFIYYITKQLYNEKAAKISAVMTAFWPSLFIWSTQNLKESLSIFLTAILIWGVVQLKKKFRFYLVFLMILASIALKELRLVSFSIFYAVVLPLSLILFLWKKNKVLFIFLIACAGLIAGILVNDYLIKTYSYSPMAIIKYLHQMRTYRTYGNTAFLSNLDIFNPVIFVVCMPVMVLVAWLAPFPWQIGSMSQISAVPEMVLYYSLLPAMFLGWRFISRYKIREGGVIIVYIFIMMLVIAFIEGNIGTLFRHRAMVLPFMFILIAIGLDKMKFKITAHN